MLKHACHHHLEHLFDIGKRFLSGMAPGRGTTTDQGWTIYMPAIVVRLDNDFEGVSGQRRAPVKDLTAAYRYSKQMVVSNKV
jgi:hypothetical protein